MYRQRLEYGDPEDFAEVIRTTEKTFRMPTRLDKPSVIFTCSWSDFFIADADPWRAEAWDIIRSTPHLLYQILTKRPENIAERLPSDWGQGYENVWLGVTVELEKYLSRIEVMRANPAVSYFVSYEPALGPVDFTPYLEHDLIQWLISGGESGGCARRSDIQWFRNARDACRKYGVPYLHRQNGGGKKVNGVWGGNRLDGEIIHEHPEMPNVPWQLGLFESDDVHQHGWSGELGQ
jgi:protein gp37